MIEPAHLRYHDDSASAASLTAPCPHDHLRCFVLIITYGAVSSLRRLVLIIRHIIPEDCTNIVLSDAFGGCHRRARRNYGDFVVDKRDAVLRSSRPECMASQQSIKSTTVHLQRIPVG